MSRFNPDHEVEAVYTAAKTWKERCLIADGSVFTDEKLWRTDLLDELDELYIVNENEDKDKNYWVKLKEQIKNKGSLECKQLMAEIHWAIFLFSLGIRTPTTKSAIKIDKKRNKIIDVWSWSGEKLKDDNSMLSDDTLEGIGHPGSGYNRYRWQEISLLIKAVQILKTLSPNERRRHFSDPWQFARWLRGLAKTPNLIRAPKKIKAANRQLNHTLPHLLFPDVFERTSTKGDKWKILSHHLKTPEKEVKKWDFNEIDRALLNLRRDLEKKYSKDIDFYETKPINQWLVKKLSNRSKKRI